MHLCFNQRERRARVKALVLCNFHMSTYFAWVMEEGEIVGARTPERARFVDIIIDTVRGNIKQNFRDAHLRDSCHCTFRSRSFASALRLIHDELFHQEEHGAALASMNF